MADKTAHFVEIPHSPLGPSASERWLNCPGSVLLTADMEDPDSWFAAEGTAAHELSEWCRREGKSAEFWRGQIIKVGQYEFEIDQEMIDGVNDFVEECEQWPGEGLYEVRVSYNEWVPNAFGTMDDARLIDGLARVTDLKYGEGVWVDAQDNSQLKLYALGLYHDYRHLYDFNKFILTISQPRLNNLDRFELNIHELLNWAEDVVRPTAEAALKPGAKIKPGDWCVFCPARRVCRARAEMLTKELFNDFVDLDAKPPLLTNDEIAVMLPHVANGKKFLNDLEAHALSEIAKGNSIVHPRLGAYKAVAGRSNRAWAKKPDTVAAAVAMEFGVDESELYLPATLKSPAQIEKIKGIGRGKLPEELVSKPQGKPKLAPGTDPAPALEFKAENEFGSLD